MFEPLSLDCIRTKKTDEKLADPYIFFFFFFFFFGRFFIVELGPLSDLGIVLYWGLMPSQPIAIMSSVVSLLNNAFYGHV